MSSTSPSVVSEPETRPLLKDGSQVTYDAVDNSVDYEVQEDESPSSIPSTKPISRADLIWVLTGLWSAVFLGALDGSTSRYILRILY